MAPFSFPKAARLLKAYQFRRVSKQGHPISGRHLSIQACQGKSLKLGLTVTRKCGKAVQRNRFKRLVREAFRLSQHQLPSSLHLNIRPTAKLTAPLTLETVQRELLQLTTQRG